MTMKEDLAGLKENVSSIKERQIEEAEKHEGYRRDVHKRFGETHSIINSMQEQMSQRHEVAARRIDATEHDIQNTTKMLEEFKIFGDKITTVVQEIKDYIIADKAKNSTKSRIIEFIFKLAAFSAAVVAIVKYLGMNASF